MNLIAFATSSWGARFIIWLCRVLPCSLSYRLCDWAAGHLTAQRDHPFVSALRHNMAVVHHLSPADPELDQIVARLLLKSLCSYVDLFRAAAGPAEMQTFCQINPAALRMIRACRQDGRGLVLVGAHMCSFDLMLLGLKNIFPAVQLLSNADPQGSSRLMNQLRRQHGLQITPISLQSLRQAVETLRAGGVVAIAADLPAQDGAELTFFGRPARLLIGHARLAIKTGATMLVGASHRVGRGAFRAEIAPVPRPSCSKDQQQDAIAWAQDSLAALEKLIRDAPDEWLMPHPIWPAQPAGLAVA